MSFTGNEGAYVNLTDASAWTATYRNINPGATKAHFFGRNKLMEILGQPGCVGIRAYYAIDAQQKKQLVLVGADANEKDMAGAGLILDQALPCPSNCDQGSALYST